MSPHYFLCSFFGLTLVLRLTNTGSTSASDVRALVAIAFTTFTSARTQLLLDLEGADQDRDAGAVRHGTVHAVRACLQLAGQLDLQ